jgi:hypothetical protein
MRIEKILERVQDTRVTTYSGQCPCCHLHTLRLWEYPLGDIGLKCSNECYRSDVLKALALTPKDLHNPPFSELEASLKPLTLKPLTPYPPEREKPESELGDGGQQ